MKDLVEIVAAMASKRGEVAVCTQFGNKSDEVAILLTTSDRKHLRFAAPRKFTELGTIPVTKRDSIAVSIFNRGTGEAMNNVPMVKHVAFFESVKIRDRVAPIQKMVTVPIVYDSQVVGVAQISRKGETPAEAGPDFTPADVTRAEELFQAVAPYLVQVRPDRF
jgi:hypothetical protein